MIRAWGWAGVAGLLTGLLICSSPRVSVAADSPTVSAQKAIQTILDKQNAAAKRLDVAGTWAGTADDFHTTVDGHTMNAAQCKAMLTALFHFAQSVNGTSHVDKITLHGDSATVLVTDIGTIVVLDPQKKSTY